MKINSMSSLRCLKGWLLLPILLSAVHQAEAKKTYHHKADFTIHFEVYTPVNSLRFQDQITGYSEGSARGRAITKKQKRRLRAQARQNAMDELTDTFIHYIASNFHNGGHWGGYDLSDTDVTLTSQDYNQWQPRNIQEFPGLNSLTGYIWSAGNGYGLCREAGDLPISLYVYVEFNDGATYSTRLIREHCSQGYPH
jgi:hypothetical protein